MKRGELYRVFKGNKNDPKDHRVYLIVSRQVLIESQFPTVICAPIRTNYGSLPTQIEIGTDEGFKYDCAVFCDDLISLQKSLLTDYVGSLSDSKMEEVNTALRIALAVE
jgi:mRNA interferase MazF